MLNIHLDTSEFDERVSEKMGKTIIRAPFMQHYHTNTFEIDKRVRFYLDRHSKNIERLYYPVTVDIFLILIFVYFFILSSKR